MSRMWTRVYFMKLFLAGTCAFDYLKPEIQKSLFILESFAYFKEWQVPLIHTSKDFLLDSGAFTFLSSKKTKSVNFDEYLDKYIKFINENDIKLFFELDIDSVVGYPKVLEYRKKLEYETGKKCIPVWHRSRGKDEYYSLCENYSYIAIGGLAIKEIKKSEHHALKTLCDIAKTHNCNVHGLGFTPTSIEKYSFYSCDSTTWIVGGKFADLSYFDGKRMRRKKFPDKRLIDYKSLNKINLLEWLKYQKYLYYYK